MKMFTKMTKLYSIKGRQDYITDPNRQENLISVLHTTDYSNLEKFESNNSRSKNQGREMIVALPNEWLELPKQELEKNVLDIIDKFIDRDKQEWSAAIHLNKTKTNLHTHILFSEREIEKQEYQIYKKDVWLKENGSLAIKKADRHTLIHKKGEIKLDGENKPILSDIQYGIKQRKYYEHDFLKKFKKELEFFYKERGIEITENVFKETHRGKGNNAFTDRIDKENDMVREINDFLPNLEKPFQDHIKQQKQKKNEKKANFLLRISDLCVRLFKGQNELKQEQEEKEKARLEKEKQDKLKQEREQKIQNSSWTKHIQKQKNQELER